MRLLKDAPHIAHRPCDLCRELWFDDSPGGTGRPRTTGGKNNPRPAGSLPCEDPAQSCPKGHWKTPRTLTPENEQAYRHFREARAVGYTPEESADPIVRRNGALILQTLEDCDRDRQNQLLTVLASR